MTTPDETSQTIETAIILCPGPSLARFNWGRQLRPRVTALDCDLVVTVNRAALAYYGDVWACGDFENQQRLQDQVIANIDSMKAAPPALLLADCSAASMRDRITAKKWPGQIIEFYELESASGGVRDWNLFTATAALVYAARRGVKHLYTWGADMHGAADWDGTANRADESGQPAEFGEVHGNRSVARWELESKIWHALLDRFNIEWIKG